MADAVLEIWQSGTMAGAAVSGILSGRHNPSGKLSATFPQTTGQIPIYYNMRQSARPDAGHYQDIPKNALYWFGHGLSNSSFEYGKIKLSKNKIKKSEKIVAEIEITNKGNVDGKEAVLWYINDPVTNISRPIKELKFFEKKMIKAGKKEIYRFEIDPEKNLTYVDSIGEKHLEPGDFYILINNEKVKFELMD